ncbi:granzyme K isoform X2 [Alosa pseudoharengus]|uniref:granzyme K isoform X2 n=1 Tax=Alosa pseudoharengus TaxID=34774 RepID=UPI003F8B69CF
MKPQQEHTGNDTRVSFPVNHTYLADKTSHLKSLHATDQLLPFVCSTLCAPKVLFCLPASSSAYGVHLQVLFCLPASSSAYGVHLQSFPSLGDVTVLLGAHSLKNEKNTIRVGIERCEIPRTFRMTTKADDIMLMKLKDKVKVKKEKVKTVKLPKSHKDIPSKTKCQVTGWGVTDPNGKKASDTLKYVEVSIIERDYCTCLYNQNPVITEDMLCAGNKKPQHDACLGDSGGPLECNKNLVGLVSGGLGCGDPKKPGVYTRLSEKHMSWINNIIKRQSNSTVF